MLDSYIFLGGSGATLGLIIAIFLASRRPDYRQVAKLALPSGLFQINEPILFGLPIIMNPVMFIPFILVQPILAASLAVTVALAVSSCARLACPGATSTPALTSAACTRVVERVNRPAIHACFSFIFQTFLYDEGLDEN